jgi:hypothetical protein
MKNSKIGKKLSDNVKKSQNFEEKLLFPKKEWNELVKWRPVSNIPVEEIYKDLPEVKQFHDSYCRFWLNKKSR